MTKPSATTQEVADALRRAVEGKPPQYRYFDAYTQLVPETETSYGRPDGCQYLAYGVPCCLVGAALHDLGVSTRELQRCEGLTAEEVVPSLIDTTPAAKKMLDKAQRLQDSGNPWQYAVVKAIASHHYRDDA